MVRQDIAKLVCCRECLCRDLLASERETIRGRQHAGPPHFTSRSALPQSASDARRINTQQHQHQIPYSAQPSLNSSQPTASQLTPSRSQDELAKSARSPSKLRRSLTAEQAARPVTAFESESHTISSLYTSAPLDDSPLLPPPRIHTNGHPYSRGPSSPSRRASASPVASSPSSFEPLLEDEKEYDEQEKGRARFDLPYETEKKEYFSPNEQEMSEIGHIADIDLRI